MVTGLVAVWLLVKTFKRLPPPQASELFPEHDILQSEVDALRLVKSSFPQTKMVFMSTTCLGAKKKDHVRSDISKTTTRGFKIIDCVFRNQLTAL